MHFDKNLTEFTKVGPPPPPLVNGRGDSKSKGGCRTMAPIWQSWKVLILANFKLCYQFFYQQKWYWILFISIRHAWQSRSKKYWSDPKLWQIFKPILLCYYSFWNPLSSTLYFPTSLTPLYPRGPACRSKGRTSFERPEGWKMSHPVEVSFSPKSGPTFTSLYIVDVGLCNTLTTNIWINSLKWSYIFVSYSCASLKS